MGQGILTASESVLRTQVCSLYEQSRVFNLEENGGDNHLRKQNLEENRYLN